MNEAASTDADRAPAGRVNFPAAYPAHEDGATRKAKLVRLDRRCVHLRREAATGSPPSWRAPTAAS